MKGKLIGAYLAISFIFGTWSYFFGPYQYRSYAFNLGTGIAWPVTIFKSDPTQNKNGYRSGKMIQNLESFWKTYFSKSNADLAGFGNPELTIAVE